MHEVLARIESKHYILICRLSKTVRIVAFSSLDTTVQFANSLMMSMRRKEFIIARSAICAELAGKIRLFTVILVDAATLILC